MSCMYFIVCKQGILSCYRMNGDLLWSSNQGNIHDIRGLSIDRHGFAYAHVARQIK
jgi:hypothetical protein